MKKIILFLLILSIVFVFASCISNPSKTTIKIRLKGDPVSVQSNRQAFDELWDTAYFEIKDKTGFIVESFTKTKNELSSPLEFTRDNFMGEYTIEATIFHDSPRLNVASGSITQIFSQGLNNVEITVNFLKGDIKFNLLNYTDINYTYKVKLYDSKTDSFLDLPDTLTDGMIEEDRTFRNINTGVYELYLEIYEGTNNLVWSNSDTPFIVEVHPSVINQITFDPLSKNKISFNLPYETAPYDLSASQAATSTSVELSWRYNYHDPNVIYSIYKKVGNAPNYRLLSKIDSSSFDKLNIDGNLIKWTDTNTVKGNIKYAVNVSKAYEQQVKESGYIEFDTINVLPVVETPQVSVTPGTYSDPFILSLSTNTPDAIIYYTTDGNIPTIDSIQYGGSFTVTPPQMIKAIAVKEGYKNSDIMSVVYTVPQWNIVGTSDFSSFSSSAEVGKIALDSAGYQYVVFADPQHSDKATVKKFNGTSWITLGEPGFSTGKVIWPYIDIDGTGVPYVVYRDNADSDRIRVMKYDSSSGWINVGNQLSSNYSAYPELTFDSNNNPYVIYMDGDAAYKATVKKYNGSTWEAVGGSGISQGSISNPSIFIKDDTPYIAFMDGANGNKATAMKFNGLSWEFIGSAGFSAGQAQDVTIAVDSNDVPYVVYSDYGLSGKSGYAVVRKCVDNIWTDVGDPGFSLGGVRYTDIAITSDDKPMVVFEDAGKSYKASVMKYDGSSWRSIGNVGQDAFSGYNTSIAISDNGIPYISYVDTTSDYSTYFVVVKKYN